MGPELACYDDPVKILGGQARLLKKDVDAGKDSALCQLDLPEVLLGEEDVRGLIDDADPLSISFADQRMRLEPPVLSQGSAGYELRNDAEKPAAADAPGGGAAYDGCLPAGDPVLPYDPDRKVPELLSSLPFPRKV